MKYNVILEIHTKITCLLIADCGVCILFQWGISLYISWNVLELLLLLQTNRYEFLSFVGFGKS